MKIYQNEIVKFKTENRKKKKKREQNKAEPNWVTTVGTALGKSDEAKTVLADIDKQIADKAAEHPEFKGKTLAAVADSAGTFYVYKKNDPRVDFMFDLGFVNAPAVDDLSNGDGTFFYTLSYEQLDKLKADVVLNYATTQADADSFSTSPQTSVIPAVAGGHVAQLVGAQNISAVSPDRKSVV